MFPDWIPPGPSGAPLGADMQKVLDIIQGRKSIKAYDEPEIKGLVTSGSWHTSFDRTNKKEVQFLHDLDEAERYRSLAIVGNRYQSIMAQNALAYKNKNALVLLVREPANPADMNAIACCIACGDTEKFTWIPVGYIPKDLASKLAPNWPERNGVNSIVVTQLKDSAEMRRRKGSVDLIGNADGFEVTLRDPSKAI